MTDLKQEIDRIDKAAFETRYLFHNVSRYREIVKLAYERGELVNLLSADDDYIYNSKGELWLAPDPKLSMGMDDDPINIYSLFSSIDNLYSKTKDINVKQSFKNAFLKMFLGTETQVYFAVVLFYLLASHSLEDKYYPFADVYEELSPLFTDFITKNSEKLKSIKVYNCKDDDNGLYDMCEYYSNKIVEMGGKPFATKQA